LIDIFQQTVRQLGNLSHTTDPTKQPNFRHYAHILELFAQVKIGCVIVDLAQQEGNGFVHNDDDDDNSRKNDDNSIDEIDQLKTPTKQRKDSRRSSATKMKSVNSIEKVSPLEVVVELIHTLLHCVRNDHPIEILELVQHAITACLEEYNPDHGVPIPVSILDELLLCIGQGPTIWVINAAAHQQIGTNHELLHRSQNTRESIPSKKPPKNGSSPKLQSKLQLQVEQTNPIYVTAAAVIRSMLNKLATPVAQLLNGLLNGDTYILEQSSIRCPSSSSGATDQSPCGNDLSDTSIDVYAIVYELHRVAPHILTTVIGTVSNGLRSPDTAKRAAVTNLLGRLFSASPNISNNSLASSSGPRMATNLASEFRACYREWLGRSVDVESSIRITVMKHCVEILRQSSHLEPIVCQEASETVTKSLTNDPNLDVRLEAIHRVTDWVYRQLSPSAPIMISPSLLRAMGGRCSSKHRQERRDAITGLAKIYQQQYMKVQLKSVIAGGDDCPVSLIQDVLKRTCRLGENLSEKISPSSSKRRKILIEPNSDSSDPRNKEFELDDERYSWIPSKVFECLFYTDQTDSEMRNRVVQIIDDVLLGSTSSDATSSSSNNKSVVKMTPTSRAVGLAMILDSLRDTNNDNMITIPREKKMSKSGVSTNAYKFMQQFLTTRSRLQKTISKYIDARAIMRECKSGMFYFVVSYLSIFFFSFLLNCITFNYVLVVFRCRTQVLKNYWRQRRMLWSYWRLLQVYVQQ
jgi:hypothetical protein